VVVVVVVVTGRAVQAAMELEGHLGVRLPRFQGGSLGENVVLHRAGRCVGGVGLALALGLQSGLLSVRLACPSLLGSGGHAKEDWSVTLTATAGWPMHSEAK